MKKLHIISKIAVLFLLLIACGNSNEQATAEMNSTPEIVSAVQKSTPIRDENGWYHNWDAGMEAARNESKVVLVDFYADWCTWCDVMDEKTFSDSAIKKTFSADWITIRIDTEDAETQGTFKGDTLNYRDLARAFGVTGLPSYLFLDKNGEPVTIIAGYKEKDEFALILDYFHKEIYKEDEATQKEFLKPKS